MGNERFTLCKLLNKQTLPYHRRLVNEKGKEHYLRLSEGEIHGLDGQKVRSVRYMTTCAALGTTPAHSSAICYEHPTCVRKIGFQAGTASARTSFHWDRSGAPLASGHEKNGRMRSRRNADKKALHHQRAVVRGPEGGRGLRRAVHR